MNAEASQLGFLGLVVCGGKSRRMGSDKALLDLAGSRLVERAVLALRSVTVDVVLGTGETERYGELGLECVIDPVHGAGPLAGLVAGLECAQVRGASALLVSACDTPRASDEVFGALSRKWEAIEADALLLQTSDGIEPLIAIYRITCAAPARAALAAGKRRMTSFHDSIEVSFLDAREVAVEAPATNINTPEELEAERQFLGDRS